MGQMMARLGVKVVLLQRSTRLVPEHEPEIGRAIQEILEEEGIGVVTGVQIERLGRENGDRFVQARVMGRERRFLGKQILMALGREANTQGMGLEHVQVRLGANGHIEVDEYMQSSNPTIYATGDVTNHPEYVYLAAAGGTLAAQNVFSDTRKPLDLSSVPGVIFTEPQIATVGLTEARAKQQGREVITSTLPMKHVARALANHDTRGLIKLVADKNSQEVLGAHILAEEAGEAIQTATLAVKFHLTIEQLTDTLFPYLTQVEGLKLAAQAFEKDLSKLSCCAG
jgi:mercuric reductase